LCVDVLSPVLSSRPKNGRFAGRSDLAPSVVLMCPCPCAGVCIVNARIWAVGASAGVDESCSGGLTLRDDGAEALRDDRLRPRVLVVDNEEGMTDLVGTALRYEGFQVEVAGSGRDALAAATSFRPHLIVLDVMLPDLSRFEVQRGLAADRLRVPIVFLTARDTTEAKVQGLSMGADDYVTKPFSLEELEVLSSTAACVECLEPTSRVRAP
jgi:CheY-like chemotaxis protein